MVDHDRLLLRLAKRHLTRCPYCGKDYAEIPFPKLRQFRCLGCSAFISHDMLVEELDDEVFERDTRNVCRHCGFHWDEETAPPARCPGCMETLSQSDLLTERDFAGLDRGFAPVVNQTGSSRGGCLLLVAALVLLLFFQGLFFGCLG